MGRGGGFGEGSGRLALCFAVVDNKDWLLSWVLVVFMPYLVARKCQGGLPDRWGSFHELPGESRAGEEREEEEGGGRREEGGEAGNMVVSFARWAAQNGCVLEQGLPDGVDAAPSVMKPGVSSSPELSLNSSGRRGRPMAPGHTTLLKHLRTQRKAHHGVDCSTCCKKKNRGIK